MTKEEIDILWNKALRQSVDDGSLYTRYRFAELVAEAERNRTWTQDHWTEYERSIAAAEREKVARWQIGSGYSTGHGDTIEDLLVELEWQIREVEREACAKVCDETLAQHYMKQTIPERDEALFLAVCADCAAAIRARGETK